MTVTQTAAETVQVELTPDKQAAYLVVPARLPRNQITEAKCKAALLDAGVHYSSGVANRLQQVLGQLPAVGQAVKPLIAQGRPPEHGTDAKLHWLVTEPDQVDEDTSFYDRCAYVMVQTGQVVGQIEPATHGQDGLDVIGNPAPATPGQPLEIAFDQTIVQDEHNQLVAQIDGQLVRQPTKAYITQELEIKSSVDFSTGNLDFSGNILVYEAVRDRFEVKATGHVEVRGVIETATVKSGGDLTARGGIAGHRAGELHISGDLIARYLNRGLGEIAGDLYIEREVMDSLLSVAGAVPAPSSTLIGGILATGGAIDVKVIGSEAGTATELVLGCSPRLQKTLHETHLLRNQAELRRSQLLEDDGPTRQRADLSRWREQDRRRKLQYLEDQIESLNQARRSLLGAFERDRGYELTVRQRLYEGTVITAPDGVWQISTTLNGPVYIRASADGQPTYQQANGGSRPLSRIAKSSQG
jgi:uncharacterized protein (DUF342 family)